MKKEDIKIKWEDIQIGDVFPDGSSVIQIHEKHEIDSYTLTYTESSLAINRLFFKNSPHIFNVCLSSDHYLLCDISKLRKNIKSELISRINNISIPSTIDCHLSTVFEVSEESKDNISKYLRGELSELSESDKEILDEATRNEVTKEAEPILVSEDLAWLSVSMITWLLSYNQQVYCNGFKIIKSMYSGSKIGMCVSTDSGKYETKHLIHHNSVSLRNIIFHCLTHQGNNGWALGLIDLKITEFTQFKNPLSIDTQLYVKHNDIVNKTTMGDLDSNDMVMGSDGAWHTFNLLPVHIPQIMFSIEFSSGKIKCSGDHLWNIFNQDDNSCLTVTTEELYNLGKLNFDFQSFSVGSCFGIKIVKIIKVVSSKARCIEVYGTSDNQFAVLTDTGGGVFTHNCKGVVAVATTITEAAELLRMARQIMYKRNKEMAKVGVTDIADYIPSKPSEYVRIFGAEFKDDYQFQVKVDGVEQTMVAKDILSYLEG